MKKILLKIPFLLILCFSMLNFKCLSPGLPENQKIFFNVKDPDLYIAVMDIDGKNLKYISVPNCYYPSASPDGTKVLYISGGGSGNIMIMNSDGSNAKTLVTGDYSFPTFSSDGTKVICTKRVGMIYVVVVMNNDGSNEMQITNDSISARNPSLSPSSNVITFASGSNEIYKINIDGTKLTKLTNRIGLEVYNNTTFSPDGRKIAFDSNLTGNYEIYIMDIDGENMSQITNGITDDSQYPSFSPDGSKIIFVRNYNVYMINTDGSGEKLILSSLSAITFPCFSGKPR